MEMEINRLKHNSTEKELTIEDLNRQYMSKVDLLSQKLEKSLPLNDKQNPPSPQTLRSVL